MKQLERSLNFTELGVRITRESRLALLVLPLLTPGQPESTPDFALEFADAFNIVFLLEGKQTFNFINNLKKQEKEKLINILIQGGMGGTAYISDDDILSI
jgi:hypothetical protein